MADITPYSPPVAGDSLPSRTGNSGKYLRTDGENLSWEPLVAVEGFPNQSGNAGKFLTTNGNAASWSNPLPIQSGNAGKYLFTNGSSARWESLPNFGVGGNGSNSALLDTFSSPFNGTDTVFQLRYNGAPYSPPNAACIMVVLGGITQKPGEDYTLSGNEITFTTPPTLGLSCFIVALGGLGIVSTDSIWTAKGTLAVGSSLGNAVSFPVGTEGQVLTVASGTTTGLQWKTLQIPTPTPGVPVGSVFYLATQTAPSGYLICDGSTIPTSGTLQGINAALLQDLRNAIGTIYGSLGTLPDLRGEFIRGWDGTRGIDSARTFGSFQADEFKSHSHTVTVSASGLYQVQGNDLRVPTANPGIYTTSSVGGTETRPRNIALLPIIKY